MAAALNPTDLDNRLRVAEAVVEFGSQRVINNAQRQFAGGDQAHRHAPEGDPSQKIVRVVDRVDHPYRSGIRVACASFLTNKTVARKQPR